MPIIPESLNSGNNKTKKIQKKNFFVDKIGLLLYITTTEEQKK